MLKTNLRSVIAQQRGNLVFRQCASICRKYLSAYDNQFNWNVVSNGERFIVDAVTRRRPGIVFDVGANIGAYSLMCAELGAVQRIDAFEISPQTFATLKNNCQADAKIRLNPFGLSDSSGVVKIFHAVGSCDRTSIHPIEHGFQNDMVTADVTTGDAYIDSTRLNHVSFLKIDVEGADLAALRGFIYR